jgi:hypothetical protein
MIQLSQILRFLGSGFLLYGIAIAQSALERSDGSKDPPPRVDLTGRWTTPPFVNNAGEKIAVNFTIIQKGENVTAILNHPGKPHLVMFEGHFEGGTRLKGRSRGPSSSDDNPNWAPETLVIVDPSHLKSASTPFALVKVGAPESIKADAAIPAEKAKSYLREKPFDLNGTWQGVQNHAALFKLVIAQKDGDLTMRYQTVAAPFFRGRYVRNPTIAGQGISRKSDLKNPTWVEVSIFVDDPDHIRYNVEGRSFILFRVSNPSSRDIACDDRNSNHVARFFATVRGRMANSEHDLRSAKCWLTIGANEGYASAQSQLAAVLLRQPAPTEVEYRLAFEMAMKSAQQGDIAGQLETASLYREGKGTPKDLGKAEFWTQKAQQSKMAAQWKLWNSDVFLGLSPLDIAGLALKASNAVIADIDESAMRFSCADGRTADCEALKRRQ